MAGEQQQQQQTQVTAEDARTFISSFGHEAEALKALPDTDVLKWHGTLTAAQKKSAEEAVTKAGEGWREGYVARVKAGAEKSGQKDFDEQKLLGRLQRYGGLDAALDALVSTQNKISAGELKPLAPFPDKGTPEQQTAWRKERGLPEKPEGYEVQLPAGMALGEEDKPALDSFKAVAHALHMSPAQVSGAAKWYLDTVEAQAAERHEKDVEIMERVEDELRAEWAGDYRRNKAMIEAFLDQGGKDVKEAFLNARLDDGTPLASDPRVLRFLIDRSREVIDAATVTPGDAASMAKSVDDELQQIKSWMQAPRGSAEYQKYWGDTRMQERYRQLLASKEKMGRRAA